MQFADHNSESTILLMLPSVADETPLKQCDTDTEQS